MGEINARGARAMGQTEAHPPAVFACAPKRASGRHCRRAVAWEAAKGEYRVTPSRGKSENTKTSVTMSIQGADGDFGTSH